MRTRQIAAVAMAAALFGSACEDELDFGFGDWEEDIDTLTIYTLERPEYQGMPAALDIVSGVTRRVEDAGATGGWDVALTGGVAGAPLTLTPLGEVLSLNTQAAVAPVALPFDELDIAPRDSAAYVSRGSVPVELDSVYVIRSREASNGLCAGIFFAKIEAIEVDEAAGSATFMMSANPNCNDRDLIPPED